MLYKSFFTYILLLFNLFVFSQNRIDTQEWVKSAFDLNIYSDFHINIVKFSSDGKIMSIICPYSSDTMYDDLPLKEINQIFITKIEKETYNKEKYSYYKLTFKCKNESKCFTHGKFFKGKKSPYDNGSIVEYRLASSLENNDMATRLKKALTHLIVLQGGKLINDTF